MNGRGRLRAATFALFAIAAVATSRPLAAQDIACDPGDVEVVGLEFRGNRAVEDDDLALVVSTTPSSRLRRTLKLPLGQKRCLDRAAFVLDPSYVQEYYRRRGFYYSRVDTTVQAEGREAVRVIFTIEEGAPTILQSYEVSGLEGVRDASAMLEARRLHAGRPFDIDLFSADMDTIVQRLRNAGYHAAELLHQYDRDSLTARASITVLPGRRARFGEPVFVVTPLPGREQQLGDAVIRRVMGIVPGTWYSDRAVVEAQRSLFGLGVYRHIEVTRPDSLQPPGDSVVVLQVQLTEDYMKQLDSEFGWATLDCGRVRLLYTDRNLAGQARRLEVTGQASKIGYGEPLATERTRQICDIGGRSPLKEDFEFSQVLHYYTGVSLRQPRLLGFRWTPTLSVYSERRGEYRAYLRRTYIGGDLSAARELAARTPVRLAYTAEYGYTEAPDAALCALFNRCDSASRETLKEQAWLGIASASVARLRTDHPITPTRGYALRGEVRTSASALLGTSQRLFFNKGTADAIWYHPLGASAVFATRLRGGVVVGRRSAPNDPGFVPPQERLYAGGATSVRGFQQNELGDVVYIAGSRSLTIDSSRVSPAGDTLYRMEVHQDSVDVNRTVPLGGNTLAVINFDYRVRDPFFFPDVLQYTFFVDGGAIGTRRVGQGLEFPALKWTPGIGVRALTPIGPVQVNMGWNPYGFERGPLYYNPNVATLHCVTPGNQIDLVRDATRQLRQVDETQGCPEFQRPPRRRVYQQLTFTFSIGPDF